MSESTVKNYNEEEVERLAKAFLSLNNIEECKAFFRDLLTAKETVDLSSRLEVARLLKLRENYNDIAAATGASTATISRVSKCLSGERGGYRTVLSRLEEGDSGYDGLTCEQLDAIKSVIACFKNNK